MNKKLIGSICLVSGTAIGAGMLALPMTLAKLGLCPTLIIMFVTWLIMYYSALVNLELNLKTEAGMPLGALGRFYSGRVAGAIGSISLILLSYALLSAYLYGGSSILQAMIQHVTGGAADFSMIMVCYAVSVMGLLMFAFAQVERVNRLLFCGLLFIVGMMIIALFPKVSVTSLPLFESGVAQLGSWALVLPTVFTSFGFQVIFHTLTSYCEKDPQLLKRAFLWGSLIPLIVYVLWTLSVVGVLYTNNPALYDQIITGGVEVGQLIEGLAQVTNWSSLKLLSWIISILAILTSVIGVSLGLMDTWRQKFVDKSHWAMLCLTIIPPCLVALFIPNAFINALGFAGMILVIIAILLPLYLLQQALKGAHASIYPMVTSKTLQLVAVVFGLGIMGCAIINMIG